MARYGLSIDDAESFLMTAVGGEKITTTIEGRERYPVNLRYARDYRSSIDRLQRALLTTPGGAQIPIAQVAQVELVSGPSMIRDENGMLNGYVYVDVAGRDIGGYVEEAKQTVSKIKLPTGYSLVWSGQYENMQRVRERLTVVLPLTLVIIFVLAVFQYQIGDQDNDHPACGSVFRCRRNLAAVLAQLQHQHRCLGRTNRTDGR